MSLRWDPRDDALEDYAISTDWTEDFYPDWDGFDAAGRILLAAIDSVLELLPPAPEGLTAGSSPARGHQGAPGVVTGRPLPLCVVCDDIGCSHCPGVAA